jgi:aldose 1-epimerase
VSPAGARSDVGTRTFGTTPGGERAEIFTLSVGGGLEVRATNYGGIIASIRAPDRDGRPGNVVLGHDSLDGYAQGSQYVGAVIGRYANRIAHAGFTLDGTTYRLTANHGPHHLHGGRTGFDRVLWRAAPFAAGGTAGLTLTHTSPDGDEGYPGTLDVRVTYTVTDRRELVVDYRATTDRATPVNLTQHSYFNLAGSGDALDHLLRIDADAITPVDGELIPTGAVAPVAGTPFDFRSPTAIGARLGAGYDHNFVLNRAGPGLVHAARLEDPVSGRTLDVHTTEPGLQLYTGARTGLCLETQHFPDSPNQPAFPSTILRPGAEYRSQTVFAFGVTR